MHEFFVNKFLYEKYHKSITCKYCMKTVVCYAEDVVKFNFDNLEKELTIHLMECESYQIYLKQVGKYI